MAKRNMKEDGMSEEKLWCVHVHGPDDVLPAASQDEAERWAHALNLTFARTRPKALDPVLRALPAEWPWSAEDHARGLVNVPSWRPANDGCAACNGTGKSPALHDDIADTRRGGRGG